MRIGGSYDYRYVHGSQFTCSCGWHWGFANVNLAQARREGLDSCAQCGKRSKGKATRTPL